MEQLYTWANFRAKTRANKESIELPPCSGESRRDRHPFVFFENAERKLFSLHKCVIAAKKSDLTDAQLVSLVPKAASEALQVGNSLRRIRPSASGSEWNEFRDRIEIVVIGATGVGLMCKKGLRMESIVGFPLFLSVSFFPINQLNFRRTC